MVKEYDIYIINVLFTCKLFYRNPSLFWIKTHPLSFEPIWIDLNMSSTSWRNILIRCIIKHCNFKYIKTYLHYTNQNHKLEKPSLDIWHYCNLLIFVFPRQILFMENIGLRILGIIFVHYAWYGKIESYPIVIS